MNVHPALVAGWLSTVPRDPAQMKSWTANVRNYALGAAGTSTRVSGPPGPGGEPTTIPLGEANRYGTGAAGGAPGAPGASGTAPPASHGMPVALSPDQQSSIALMYQDRARQSEYLQEILPWMNARDAVSKLRSSWGTTATGPGTEQRQQWASFINSFSPTMGSLLGIDPRKLQNYDEARKYLTQAAQTRASGFGHGTDAQLATSITATPNVSMNDLAVDDLINVNIAMRRAEYAQSKWAERFGGPDYAKYKSDWARQNDIRAFGLDLMTPEARTKLLSSLKKGTPEYDRFNNSLRAAHDAGVIDMPAAPSPAPAAGAASRSIAPTAAGAPSSASVRPPAAVPVAVPAPAVRPSAAAVPGTSLSPAAAAPPPAPAPVPPSAAAVPSGASPGHVTAAPAPVGPPDGTAGGPRQQVSPAPPPTRAVAPSPGDSVTDRLAAARVVMGDQADIVGTINSVARKYNLDPRKVAQGSGLGMRYDEEINARAAVAPTVNPPAAPQRHLIAPGDTLNSVAQRYKVDPMEIARASGGPINDVFTKHPELRGQPLWRDFMRDEPHYLTIPGTPQAKNATPPAAGGARQSSSPEPTPYGGLPRDYNFSHPGLLGIPVRSGLELGATTVGNIHEIEDRLGTLRAQLNSDPKKRPALQKQINSLERLSRSLRGF
jgi:LysM repeat protein